MEQAAARRGKCTDGRNHSTAVHDGHVKVPGVLHIGLKSIDQLSVFSGAPPRGNCRGFSVGSGNNETPLASVKIKEMARHFSPS